MILQGSGFQVLRVRKGTFCVEIREKYMNEREDAGGIPAYRLINEEGKSERVKGEKYFLRLFRDY